VGWIVQPTPETTLALTMEPSKPTTEFQDLCLRS
jgi:hypothetical protein